MIVGILAGAICGFTGVYVVLRRMVFISATLTQVSGLGVVLAFYLQSVAAGTFIGLVSPFYFTIAITCIAAVFFSLNRDFFPITLEGIIGFGFLIAGALTIIIGDRIPQGSHQIDNILFGSAVVVDRLDMIFVPVVTLISFILHKLFFKDFVFVSIDSELAELYRYPVRMINVSMFLILGTVVAVTTRALGALTVFSLLALPALTSLYLTERLKYVFIISTIIGIISASVGYFISFIFSMPTGASVVLTGSVIFIVCYSYTSVRKLNSNGFA
jgi:zinc transport system permease protein